MLAHRVVHFHSRDLRERDVTSYEVSAFTRIAWISTDEHEGDVGACPMSGFKRKRSTHTDPHATALRVLPFTQLHLQTPANAMATQYTRSRSPPIDPQRPPDAL